MQGTEGGWSGGGGGEGGGGGGSTTVTFGLSTFGARPPSITLPPSLATGACGSAEIATGDCGSAEMGAV